jgi:hypothetical protein
MSRPLPRPFSFPWGKGQIIEEASYRGAHHEPCLQLLQFEDGTELLRLCSYTLSGRFERNSWLAGADELSGLALALEQAPRIRARLTTLTARAAEGQTSTRSGGHSRAVRYLKTCASRALS